MDTNVNYTIVGAFVISFIAATVLSIIWLSSGFSTAIYKTYAINMTESVSGLSMDSPVEFNGVDVGAVKSIEIDEKDPRLVRLLISIKSQTPVTEGTLAMLASKGITGMAFISLKDKGENNTPLEAKGDQPYPVIPTMPSLFLRLDQALSQLSANLQKVTTDLHALLDKDNLASIHGTLSNLKSITANMAANNKQINTILTNTALISKRMEPLITSSTNMMRALEVQTLPATYRILTNLESMTESLADVSLEIKDNPSILIRGINRNNYGPGEHQ